MKSQVYNQPNTSSKRAHKSENNRFFNKISSAKCFILFFFFIFTAINYSQQVTKVLVSGLSGATAHDTDVMNAFRIGYSSYDGSQFTGQIDLHVDSDAISALSYANQNGYQIVVRSTTGLSSSVNNAAKNYPNVLLFMPAGSNSFSYVCALDIANAAVVSTGAGTDTLATGYRVEFFSIDPITNTNLSSFSNGYIAGQIAFLANQGNITAQQARVVARTNSFLKQSSFYAQYGSININQAVASLPVELTSFVAKANKSVVNLEWSTATEVNNYGFEIYRDDAKIGFVQGHGNSNSPKNYSFIDKPIGAKTFKYQLKQIDFDGTSKLYDPIEVNVEAPASYSLRQNYPNPFNPSTLIHFEIPQAAKVNLSIYNILGQKVATLVDELLDAGTYDKSFSTNMADVQLASGVYFYRLEVNNEIALSKKMILMK